VEKSNDGKSFRKIITHTLTGTRLRTKLLAIFVLDAELAPRIIARIAKSHANRKDRKDT
jgi:hypothetical protein